MISHLFHIYFTSSKFSFISHYLLVSSVQENHKSPSSITHTTKQSQSPFYLRGNGHLGNMPSSLAPAPSNAMEKEKAEMAAKGTFGGSFFSSLFNLLAKQLWYLQSCKKYRNLETKFPENSKTWQNNFQQGFVKKDITTIFCNFFNNNKFFLTFLLWIKSSLMFCYRRNCKKTVVISFSQNFAESFSAKSQNFLGTQLPGSDTFSSSGSFIRRASIPWNKLAYSIFPQTFKGFF